MELYILRHGLAETAPNPPSGGDSRRRLTNEGVDKMRRAAKGMKALELSFDLILSSPYLRARETAEIVAEALRPDKKLELSNALIPEGDSRVLIEELAKKYPAKKQVLIVGHEPSLSRLISLLVSGETRATFDFKKGALCKLSAANLAHGQCAALEWLMTSKQLRQIG
jgi:phosphohistidine phosphatase